MLVTDKERASLESRIRELEEENDKLRYANKAWAHECSRLNALVKPNAQEAMELLKRAVSLVSGMG